MMLAVAYDRPADQRHDGITVEKHLLVEIRAVQRVGFRRDARQLRVQAELAGQLPESCGPGDAVFDVVCLHVEDELILGPALRKRMRLGDFRRADVERLSIDLVHRQERRRHAAAGREELPARHPELAAVFVGHRQDQRLDRFLIDGLRHRVILLVGDDLRRQRQILPR